MIFHHETPSAPPKLCGHCAAPVTQSRNSVSNFFNARLYSNLQYYFEHFGYNNLARYMTPPPFFSSTILSSIIKLTLFYFEQQFFKLSTSNISLFN
jgi:hypothetical protein